MVFALLLLASTVSFGLEPQQCPQQFTLSYRQLIAMSSQRLGEENSDLQYARQVLLDARKITHQNLEFNRIASQTPQTCEYQGSNSTHAQIYTEKQTDWLRAEIQIEDLTFATHQKVARLTPKRLRLGAEAIVSLYVKVQSKDQRVGWAISPSVEP